MGRAITKKDVTIWIVDADTNPSALTDGDRVQGLITNLDQTGGGVNIEHRDVFPGKVKTITARDDFEVSLDFISNGVREEELLKYFMDSVEVDTDDIYRSNLSPKSYAIFVEIGLGADTLTYAYNDATGVTFEPSHSADDVREGTLSFTVGSETPEGQANVMAALLPAENLPNWDA